MLNIADGDTEMRIQLDQLSQALARVALQFWISHQADLVAADAPPVEQLESCVALSKESPLDPGVVRHRPDSLDTPPM